MTGPEPLGDDPGPDTSDLRADMRAAATALAGRPGPAAGRTSAQGQ